jgi:hypothetical protein
MDQLAKEFDEKFVMPFCHNLNLGLATKIRACKGVGQE